MTLAQAKQCRKLLHSLEGMIIPGTKTFIWKVMIGPVEEDHFQAFKRLVDPSRPINERSIASKFATKELTIYFFCKTEGALSCLSLTSFQSTYGIDLSGSEAKWPASDQSAESRPKNIKNQRAINEE